MTASECITKFTYFRGRVALYAILKALGVGRGDEVGMQAYTCIAVPEAVLAAGATPVFIDIEPGGLNLDPAACDAALGPRMKAIIVQHTFGLPADVRRIAAAAKKRGVPLIEDCCHSHLSTVAGQAVGSFGAGSFYSFEWGKPLVAGVGGSAIANDSELERRLELGYAGFEPPPSVLDLRIEAQYLGFRALFRPSLYWGTRRLLGALSKTWLIESSYHTTYGEGENVEFKYRMARSAEYRLRQSVDQIPACALHSNQIVAHYKEIRNPLFQHVTVPDWAIPVYARYPLVTAHKREILVAAQKCRIELAAWYQTPIHPLLSNEWHRVNYVTGSCPNAERAAAEVVSLPTHRKVNPRGAAKMIEILNAMQIWSPLGQTPVPRREGPYRIDS